MKVVPLADIRLSANLTHRIPDENRPVSFSKAFCYACKSYHLLQAKIQSTLLGGSGQHDTG